MRAPMWQSRRAPDPFATVVEHIHWHISCSRLESMRYHALATDYDGTLARGGRVDAPVLSALQRARDSGHRLILVTGRQWPDLQAIFPEYKVFHQIVAENGALLVDPESGE